MNKTMIPQTDSIEELAKFWDTHDLTDFEDQLEEIPETVFERKEGALVTIQLQPKEVQEVDRLAKSQGMEKTALIRQWILERIHGH